MSAAAAYDASHWRLVHDIEAQPSSPERSQLLSATYAYAYHCVFSPSGSPKTDLVAALQAAGFCELAAKVQKGAYDNSAHVNSAREPSLRSRGNGRPHGCQLLSF